jgi:hypothetical protein
VGAPVAGGDVRARCANDEEYTTESDDEGRYTLAIPADAFPCALEITGGDLPASIPALHSLAVSEGTTNITPLTDLILARALASSGLTPAEWFDEPSDLEAIASALGDAADALRGALDAAG